MLPATEHDTDPVWWTAIFAAAFMALAAIRLTVPSAPYFDEVHYVPAVRAWLDNGAWLNREHPMLGKHLIALGMTLLGDGPLGWRFLPWLAGGAALFAFMRAMWFASHSRFATLAFGVLLASGFALFIHARIAMLDIFMTAFFAIALWHCAAAIRQPETGKWRLALAGIAIGLSMASKWNVVFLAMLPGLAFLAARLTAGRRRLFTSERGVPIPGMSLLEAALWLGVVPLLAYWLTYLPAYFAPERPLTPGGFIAMHGMVMDTQASVTQPHPYQSNWPDWVLNIRAIWYLYEPVDGAQRGVMLIGNPLTMLLGLPALAWCAWAAVIRKRWDAMALVILYIVSLGMWFFVNKPIQFYYHYFLPSCFLLGALALALDDIRQAGCRWIALFVLAASVALFAWYYPILSAAPLHGDQAFLTWTWLDSWR